MRRLRTVLSLICLPLTVPVAAFAQDAANGLPAVTEKQAFVMGLSADDLLRVRADASPLGKTIGRLPNGALVRKRECKLVDRYEWCLVDALDVADLSGWTPGRYLQTLDIEGAETLDTADASGRTIDAASAPRAEGDAADMDMPAPATEDVASSASSVPVPQPAPRPDAAADTGGEDKGARLPAEEDVAALPPGLEARFAGAAVAPLAEAGSSEPERAPGSAAAEAPDAESVAEPAASEEAAPAAEDAGVPVPTPRPGSQGEAGVAAEPPAPAPEPEPEQVTIAAVAQAPQVRSAGPGDLAGEAPCARHVGQPMARCIVLVARTGADSADVTVVWPDGGTRLIEFRDRAPASTTSGDELRFTREGELNMIRIGVSERFEILDGLAFRD